jgi:sulfhydrogenase subunit beta (sulfur reductase)
MSLKLNHKHIHDFLRDLISEYPVYGPTHDEKAIISRFRFKKLENIKDLALYYGPTITPPKKYLMPARELLFRFEGSEVFPPDNKEAVIFGLNKKDAEGIFYLDEIMTSPVSESQYKSKREKLRLVVIDNFPPSNNLSCDLYLQRVSENEYLVFSYSEFGEKLVKKKYFDHRAPAGEISTRHMPDEVVYHPLIDLIVEQSKDHPVWKRLAKECFNCGICSYTCPLCYCFEVEDKLEIKKEMEKKPAGRRERRWDSCMLPEFNKVTFHNFRPDPKDRIYNWYYHKFVRMPREYGFPGCIDCGRCIEYCPAKINFREVLKELIDDYRK